MTNNGILFDSGIDVVMEKEESLQQKNIIKDPDKKSKNGGDNVQDVDFEEVK